MWLVEWWPRLRPWAFALLAIALASVLGVALQKLLREVSYASVMSAVRVTPTAGLIAALAATAASYLALTGYDYSSLRYAGLKLKNSTVVLTSFVAYALTNAIGFGALTGSAVQMRLYAAAGLEPAQIARMIVFKAAAFGLGITTFGALGLVWGAPELAPLLHLPTALLRGGALLTLLALGAFLFLCTRRRLLSIGGRWKLRLPPAGLAASQLLISAVELSFSAAALWFLLPSDRLGLPTFVIFYTIAIAASIISHVPGGIGVFEAVMLLAAARAKMPTDAMLGALLVYRGIYYVLPLVLATGLLASYELRVGVAAPVGRMAVRLSPRLLAGLTLIAGVWLLVSGVTPVTEDAREILAALDVPVPLIEASNFLGSVAGLGLLFVCRGLLHQLDAAWWAALVLSLIAAVLALPKGIALNEAALLTTLAVLLVISRRQFDRRSSLFAQRLEPEWMFAVGGAIAACTWVLMFAYHEVRYTNRLWWQFELDAQAPRSLRTLLGIALVALAFCLWQLLRQPPAAAQPVSGESLAKANGVASGSPWTDGLYALMGDKQLLFSPSGKSFLMYGQQGRSWVALFGPIGDRREWSDLVWRFVELASEQGGRAAFYQVRPAELPLYLDCGLRAFKLGEHAHVNLPEFNLKGARRANLRSGVNRGQREGLSFDVIAPADVAAELNALREVSDAWMAEQRAREKGFSIGRFDAHYLQQLPVAVVRRDGRPIAFANLLVTAVKDEAGVDLMRYLPDAPPGTMDFLFAKIMLHLQAEGYQRFNLGMAPMAGMAERRRAPRWQRIGRLLFEYGERFYSFRGLYNFKDKFEPVWEARYLAAPGGIAPLFVLIDVAAMIGGGVKGVIAK